ncbi:hypothetical protein DDZ15_08865 [Rhodohalobacter mucosus]|uniref:BFD-like [2Fe-2S] binding domain-containing protein n=1 Tax=Rhodohalobacter mucosus TaxID=2079485 RepID=A0A316TPT4_9BACT|nr:hypothetical protein DDZ15_08865 [Rhodohalobacter mucosus]
MSVNRCICHDISFGEINQIAAGKNLCTIEELREEEICSTQCRLCEPYIRAMLKTGQTSFEPGLIPNTGRKR